MFVSVCGCMCVTHIISLRERLYHFAIVSVCVGVCECVCVCVEYECMWSCVFVYVCVIHIIFSLRESDVVTV